MILLYVDPGWAVNVIPENINAPFFAVWVVVPVNVGVYVVPEYVPEILNVEVELLSEPTICPNSSTSAIYIVDIDPPLCWLVIDILVDPKYLLTNISNALHKIPSWCLIFILCLCNCL